MSEFFAKNTEALHKVDEPLAVAMSKLESMGLNAPLHFVKTDDGNLFDATHKEYMYQSVEAEFNEKKAYFDENFPKHPVLFLFGFGNGKLIRHLLENSNHKRIIVFESELAPIFYTLHSFDCSEALKKERLIPFYVPNLNPAQLGTLFSYENIAESVKTYNFTSNCAFYERHYQADIEKVNAELIENVRFAFIRKGNDPKDSLDGIERILYNLPKMLARASLQKLLKIRGKASKNAIVVSTGPSLIKQLPLLKEYANKATIFCADSAYSILHNHGIKPDYVLSLERYSETSELFNYDFEKEYDENITFLVAAVTDFNTTKFLESNDRKYMIALRPGLFPKFLGLDEFGYIGVNHSVGNMNFELAAYLRHENIALIGQDLAYNESGKSHPQEYKFAVNEEVDFSKKPNLPETTAYGGVGKVKTSPVWLLFKQGFENDIVMAKVRYQSRAYNCTEGGAHIVGAVELPFKEFCEKFLKQEVKKPFAAVPCLDEKEQQNLLKKTQKRLEDAFKKSDSYLEEVKKELELLHTLLPKGYELEKLDFKALAKSKKKLLNLHAKFTKSVIFTEIADVLYFQNNCELVRLDCLPVRNEREKKEALVQWLGTMGNFFIEVGEYLYTQDERIKRYIRKW